MEVDGYFDAAIDPLTTQAFSRKPEERDPKEIAKGRQAVVEEIVLFTKAMQGEFLAGPLSAADFALYPMVAFLKRCELKLPDLDADGMLTPEFRAWKERIERLSYFEKTVPPHWKQG
jgi:glutathione S-transferase